MAEIIDKVKKLSAINQDLLNGSALKNVLSRFNRHAFAEFTYRLCSGDTSRFENAGWLPEVGEDVFRASFLNSYGGTLHNVWVLHFLPDELISTLTKFHCDEKQLIEKLRAVERLYKGKTGYRGVFEPIHKAKQLQNISIVTINYSEPSLNLVIGRTPQIAHDQWRWLTKKAASGVRILTYDNLLDSMRLRLEDRESAAKTLRAG
jgi:hypothetical protein